MTQPLITAEQHALLLANGAAFDSDEAFDPPPVLKLFIPGLQATWLLASLDPACPDIAFGLCRTQHNPNYAHTTVMLIGPAEPIDSPIWERNGST